MARYIAKLKTGCIEELNNGELDEFLRHFDVLSEVEYMMVKRGE